MAKRTKKVKKSRSNLRVESLEQRQLLATIVGGGVEIGTDIQHSNGNIYDQVLMTGSSVSVKADPGQVVRVSFLDQGGDIVQAEFAGSGEMTVSLEDVKTAASAGYTNKNPDQFINGQKVNYVQGLATITIDKPELNTNLGVYAAGILQNPGFFAGQAQQGDNGLADIARVILVGDPSHGGGYSNMGGIRMGGAVFSADTGVVGIRGENVAIQSIVAIGDIDAKGSGVPTLMFNSNTQIQTVFVRGGDLVQSNGSSFNTFGAGNGGPGGGSPGEVLNRSLGGFSYFNSTAGATSQANPRNADWTDRELLPTDAGYLWATPVSQDAIRMAVVDQRTSMSGDWVYDWSNPAAVTVTVNGTDVSSAFGGDWSKNGVQAGLDKAFERRSFDGAITIKGDVPANMELHLADAKDITIQGNHHGILWVTGYGASIDTLTVTGDIDGDVWVNGVDRTWGTGDGQQNVIKSLVVGGSTGPFADIRAEDIGSVWITNNFSGILSTNVGGDNSPENNDWDGTMRAGFSGYSDYDGAIGNVTIGKSQSTGLANGGSIINGTIQGMTGIGDVYVGGDIWGSPIGTGVFVTSSNPGASWVDVRNHGSANLKSLTVEGDVDLDTSDTRLIHIAGNGIYGDITVKGEAVVSTVKVGQLPPTKTIDTSKAVFEVPLSYSELVVVGASGIPNIINSISGPVAPGTFGTLPDGLTLGSGANTYKLDPGEFIRFADVDQNSSPDLYTVQQADVGKLLPLSINTATGNAVFSTVTAADLGKNVFANNAGKGVLDPTTNTYLLITAAVRWQGEIIETPGPDITETTILAGTRGDLDGTVNNFGRIDIFGNLGAQQASTGKISWSDSVDMDFGGVTVGSQGTNNVGVIAVGTIGEISIVNSQKSYSLDANKNLVVTPTEGIGADLTFSGRIGDPQSNPENNETNISVAQIGLAGLKASGFQTILADTVGNPDYDYDEDDGDVFIAVNRLGSAIDLSTIAGSVEDGVATSITFLDKIVLNNGTSEATSAALLKLNAGGMDNSTITFGHEAGILVTDGGSTGKLSEIGNLELNADYVKFDGILRAQKIGNLSFVGGSGIGSESDRAVDFTGLIIANSVGNISATASTGDVVFAPSDIRSSNPAQVKFTQVGNVSLSTIDPDSGGDLRLGYGDSDEPRPLYQANFGNISLLAGSQLELDNAGAILDNPGHVNISFGTTGSIGNLTATTSTGNIDSVVTVQGNAGNTSLTAGVATVPAGGNYSGDPGDLVRAGSIDSELTIWGDRGTTSLTTASAEIPLPFGGSTYGFVPAGSIDATFSFAGKSTATGDNLTVSTGRGSASVQVNVIGNDDNANGVISQAEMGHGGNVNVSSVGGDIEFWARTPTLGTSANMTGTGALFQDYIHEGSMGNVTLATGHIYGVNDALDGSYGAIGNITASFNSADSGQDESIGTGFEGKVGNIALTTTAGTATLTDSRFDNNVGDVSLTAGVAANQKGGLTDAAEAWAAGETLDVTAGSVVFGGWDNLVTDQSSNDPSTLQEMGSAIPGGFFSEGAFNNPYGPVIFNANRGVISGTAVDVGNVSANIEVNAVRTGTGNAFVFDSQWGETYLNLLAGSYDSNNNGLLTAGEYARSGDIAITTDGGNVTAILNSAAYRSDLEESRIGNVVIETNGSKFERLGLADIYGATTDGRQVNANGNIAIAGSGSEDWWSAGATGDITATAGNQGSIAFAGNWGTLGKLNFTTDAAYDPDYIANDNPGDTKEATRFDVAGSIFLDAAINGKHSGVNLATIENGDILGTLRFGGQLAAATDKIEASTVFGEIDLDIGVQDFDRNGNNAIVASELGNSGDIDLKSVGGDIRLGLFTDVDNAALLATNTTDGLKFGNVTAITGDSYDNGKGESIGTNYYKDGMVRGYLNGSVSATAGDVTAMSGSIRISGWGMDESTAFEAYDHVGTQTVEANRGTVGNIKADTTRGDIRLRGAFNNLGTVDLKTGTYVDQLTAANSNAIAGNIRLGNGYDGWLGGALLITGAHDTITLTTANNQEKGTGAPLGGYIDGNVIFGGDTAAGKKAIVASTQSSDIDLDVRALWFDRNADGIVQDQNNQTVQGKPANEFADIGGIELKSAATAQVISGSNAAAVAGSIRLGLAVGSADGSTVGSSIGNVTTQTNTIVQQVRANNTDNLSNGNITITGKSLVPLIAGKIGDISADLGATGSGTITVTGNFFDIGSLTLNTGSYNDVSGAAGGIAVVTAAGNIVLGNNNTATDAGSADLNGGTTLNIAGKYNDSALTVKDQGTIKGEVFIAGSQGNTWSLTSNYGEIDVNYTAGFDADGSGGALTSNEAGKIGDIAAQSTSGNVTIGLGTRHADSLIGNVTLQTGDASVVEVAGKADGTEGAPDVFGKNSNNVIGGAGNATVEGLGSTAGTVGNISATVKTGVAGSNGGFWNVGDITLTATEAYVDNDFSASTAASDVTIWRAGDVNVNNTSIGGTHGKITLSAVDTSKLAAGANLTATIGDTGNVSGTLSLSGGVKSGTTSPAIVATTERGNVALNVNVLTTNGRAGGVDIRTTDGGDIALGLATGHANSDVGAVYTEVTDVIRTVADGADIAVDRGNITITGDHAAADNDNGKVGDLTIKVGIGQGTLRGAFGSVGAVALTAGAHVDMDASTAATNDEVLAFAGDLFLGNTGGGLNNLVIGNGSGNITARTVDSSVLLAQVTAVDADNNRSDATRPIFETGDIMTRLTIGGTSATVGGSIALESDFGLIDASIAAGTNWDDATSAADNAIRALEAGNIGPVSIKSVAGDLIVDLDTNDIASKIGDVSIKTGHVYKVTKAAADTPVSAGSISISGTGVGSLGNLTADATTGDIDITGEQFNVGSITLNTVGYIDADTDTSSSEDPVVLGTGDIWFNNLIVNGSHGLIKAVTKDDPTMGNVAANTGFGVGNAGNVGGSITFGGAVAADGGGVSITTDQGDVNLDVVAQAIEQTALNDRVAGSATTNSDNFVGAAGPITITSAFGGIDLAIATAGPVAKVAGSDSVRTSSIADITLRTGSSYDVATAGDDVAIVENQGAIWISTIGAGSNGILGNIDAKTLGAGNVQMSGTYNNKVGNIALEAGQVVDLTSPATLGGYLAAGSVTLGGSFASTAATDIGNVTLKAVGQVTDTGSGAAGSVTVNSVFGTGANKFESKDIKASVTDGTLAFGATFDGTNYVSAMKSVELKSVGASKWAGTGNINVTGGGSVYALANYTAEANDGNVTFDADYLAPIIRDVTLKSNVGNVVFNGGLVSSFANNAANLVVSEAAAASAVTGIKAITGRTEIVNVTIQAVDGMVSADNTALIGTGTAGVNAIDTALLDQARIATGTDNRTFTVKGVTVSAGNGTADNAGADGVITFNGIIGGFDTTRVSGVTFTNGNRSLDTTTLGGSIFAHNVGGTAVGEGIVFNGTTLLNGQDVIIADDSLTARNVIGSTQYLTGVTAGVLGAPVPTTATTQGLGSALNRIDGLAFNGSVAGAGADLIGGNTANVRASAIGDINITAVVDPTATVTYSVKDLNVWAGPQSGEFVANVASGAATAAGFKTADAFSMGNVFITHQLAGKSVGTSVFQGSTAFLALGKMGDIRIDSKVNGSIQAQLFDTNPAAAYFVVGDVDANLSTGNAAAELLALQSITTDGAVLGVTPEAKLTIGDGISQTYGTDPIADVYVNAASSYDPVTPPGTQLNDIGNASGGAPGSGLGLVVAAGVVANGAGSFADTAVVIDGARDWHGYIKSVEITNNSFRPDTTDVGAGAGSANTNAAVVVAADSAGKGIGDIVNDLVVPGEVEIDQGEEYTVGNAADENSVVVYVL